MQNLEAGMERRHRTSNAVLNFVLQLSRPKGMNRPLSAHSSASATTRSLPTVGIGVFLLAIAPFCFAIDLTVAECARANLFPRWLVKAANLSEFFAHGFGIIVIAILIATLDPRRIHALYVGCTALLAGLSGDLMKLVIFRIRPRDFDFAGNVWTTFHEWLPVLSLHPAKLSGSFPSSHAATAAGLAFALTTLYPSGKTVFALLTGFACLQRVFAGAHFPSDVAFGAGLGWCAAWFFTRFVLPVRWWKSTPETCTPSS
jgi:membrane-associated phospholipid phosphatase